MTTAEPQTEAEIRAFALHFLKCFEDLDMPAFIACFADDATAFFPSPPEPPLRRAGKNAIQEQFGVVFSAIRAEAAGGPPYHQLPPQDLLVHITGADTALVSFHLINGQRTARRTLVVVREAGVWRIVHLHASNGPSALPG